MGSLQWSRGSGLPPPFAQGLAQGGFGAGTTNPDGNGPGTGLLSAQIPAVGAGSPSPVCEPGPLTSQWNGPSQERFGLWISFQFPKRSLQNGERKQERRENRGSAEKTQTQQLVTKKTQTYFLHSRGILRPEPAFLLTGTADVVIVGDKFTAAALRCDISISPPRRAGLPAAARARSATDAFKTPELLWRHPK